jgi:cytochrome c oxidase subunit II
MTGAFPATASAYAGEWDRFFFMLTAISGLIVLAIFIVIVGFSIRYRRGSKAKRGVLPGAITNELELGWTSATAIVFVFLFWWAAVDQLKNVVPPGHALEIHVLAKQWMWKVQQPNGVREIDELHAPVGRPVRLIMTSQDVIHSLFLPALRLKQDVLPGRYTYLWFTADKPGVYHLLCSELCGTEHSRMTGRLVLMTAADYARWSAAQPGAEDLAADGEKLFRSLGCSGCHAPQSSVHAPDLNNVYGHKVQLSDGRSIVADEAYLRDSILLPQKDVVAGFDPIMPSFRGIVGDGDMVKLIAYLKSLASKRERP